MTMSARDEVMARFRQCFEEYNRGNVDPMLDTYTEDVIVYMDGKNPIVGKRAVKEVMGRYWRDVGSVQLEKLEFFEQFNDNTAYTLAFTSTFDNAGNLSARYKGCCLWRKIDGIWYVDHDIFNELPK